MGDHTPRRWPEPAVFCVWVRWSDLTSWAGILPVVVAELRGVHNISLTHRFDFLFACCFQIFGCMWRPVNRKPFLAWAVIRASFTRHVFMTHQPQSPLYWLVSICPSSYREIVSAAWMIIIVDCVLRGRGLFGSSPVSRLVDLLCIHPVALIQLFSCRLDIILVLDLWVLRPVNRKPLLPHTGSHLLWIIHTIRAYQGIKHRLSYPYHGFPLHPPAGSRMYLDDHQPESDVLRESTLFWSKYFKQTCSSICCGPTMYLWLTSSWFSVGVSIWSIFCTRRHFEFATGKPIIIVIPRMGRRLEASSFTPLLLCCTRITLLTYAYFSPLSRFILNLPGRSHHWKITTVGCVLRGSALDQDIHVQQTYCRILVSLIWIHQVCLIQLYSKY